MRLGFCIDLVEAELRLGRWGKELGALDAVEACCTGRVADAAALETEFLFGTDRSWDGGAVEGRSPSCSGQQGVALL